MNATGIKRGEKIKLKHQTMKLSSDCKPLPSKHKINSRVWRGETGSKGVCVCVVGNNLHINHTKDIFYYSKISERFGKAEKDAEPLTSTPEPLTSTPQPLRLTMPDSLVLFIDMCLCFPAITLNQDKTRPPLKNQTFRSSSTASDSTVALPSN